jgi:hypothetical protein
MTKVEHLSSIGLARIVAENKRHKAKISFFIK